VGGGGGMWCVNRGFIGMSCERSLSLRKGPNGSGHEYRREIAGGMFELVHRSTACPRLYCLKLPRKTMEENLAAATTGKAKSYYPNLSGS